MDKISVSCSYSGQPQRGYTGRNLLTSLGIKTLKIDGRIWLAAFVFLSLLLGSWMDVCNQELKANAESLATEQLHFWSACLHKVIAVFKGIWKENIPGLIIALI